MLIKIIRCEVLKLKRSFVFPLILLASIFSPLISFILCVSKPQTFAPIFKTDPDPWLALVNFNWNNSTSFLLPIYITLLASIIAQIEFRNNAWKQVHTLPISFFPIYLVKYILVVLSILISFILFNLFVVACGLCASLIFPEFPFINMPINWNYLFNTSVIIFIATFALSAFQFAFSLRFKNYIVPIACGILLIIAGLILKSGWNGIVYFPHSYPGLAFTAIASSDDELKNKIQIFSSAYALVFLFTGYLLVILKKDKGI